jgi:hypothetical protein
MTGPMGQEILTTRVPKGLWLALSSGSFDKSLNIVREGVDPSLGASDDASTTLTNRSATIPLNDTKFMDKINDPALTPQEQPSTATASSGLIKYSRATRTYTWMGDIAPGGSVTITLRVRIRIPMNSPPRVCNQGTVQFDLDGDGSRETIVPTSDPTPLPELVAPEPTCAAVTLRPTALQVTGLEARWLVPQQTLWFAALGAGIKAINVQIFSLTGRKAYASGWVPNGLEWKMQTANGRPIANGVYVYVVSVRGYDGKIVRAPVRKLVIVR